MSLSGWKRAGATLAAVAVVGGVTGCQGGTEEDGAAKAPRSGESVTRVIQAAYQKTTDAKSAKVRMTVTMPSAMEGGGTLEMSGVQGWNPGVMDLTMKSSLLGAGAPGAPDETRVIMLDEVMYLDMGAKPAAAMDGKRWMKLDLAAAAEAAGDKALHKQMTGGMENMNQDPARQLALLLESPNLKHVGSEKVNGVDTRHYKGTLTVEQMLDANGNSSRVLAGKDRETFLKSAEQAGMKGYDTEVWVGADGYPARMVIGMTMSQGVVHMKADYTDYGAEARVQAPPAGETVDLFQMLGELGGDASVPGAS
ncbi:hypothetical protein [Streptomyces sp. NBC_01216]|uniref:hypothetical protein n=1 Tax=unclassified Streptomyces TaxID=2593676 RepID=UPI002E10A5B7|nr:hypothetical protein OG393_12450 [Streptomyces sp. NBC_01216]